MINTKTVTLPPPTRQTHERIISASKSGWNDLLQELENNANREIVTVTWDVTYKELGHDIMVYYNVKTTEPETYLLQIWAKDQHSGFWIPEYQPWVASVVEFEPTSKVTACKGGVIDSKWRKEDVGEKYVALLWGYVLQKESVIQFGPFKKDFTYPS